MPDVPENAVDEDRCQHQPKENESEQYPVYVVFKLCVCLCVCVKGLFAMINSLR
jgi:hypothetical protein